MTNLYENALSELSGVFTRLDDSAVDKAVAMIAAARNVVVFGGGREPCWVWPRRRVPPFLF
jgi:6-phospho-3-hexuloisomerase